MRRVTVVLSGQVATRAVDVGGKQRVPSDLSLPGPIALTADESALLAKIAYPTHDHALLRESCIHGRALAESVLGRKAIPEVRLRALTDPECNPGGRGKSIQQVFEGNGTWGGDILDHPHFLPYLRYFVLGPDLPPQVIHRFWELARWTGHLSGSDLIDEYKSARATVRQLWLTPHKACTEYFRLAIECGALPSFAEGIYKNIRSMKA